jgi:hypothetical protein
MLILGFASKIKVFAEPSSKTGGLNVGGIQVTGGEDKAYLFVKEERRLLRLRKAHIQIISRSSFQIALRWLQLFRAAR